MVLDAEKNPQDLDVHIQSDMLSLGALTIDYTFSFQERTMASSYLIWCDLQHPGYAGHGDDANFVAWIQECRQ